MTDEAQDRMTHLVSELERVPISEREAFIEMLSEEDRALVWEAQLRLRDGEADTSEDELGGEG